MTKKKLSELDAISLARSTDLLGVSYVSGAGFVSTKITTEDLNSSLYLSGMADSTILQKYESNYSTVNTNSANWENTYSTVNTNSANWENTYSTVNSNSAAWGVTLSLPQSANWENTYATVSSNSANWESAGSSNFTYFMAQGQASTASGYMSYNTTAGGTYNYYGDYAVDYVDTSGYTVNLSGTNTSTVQTTSALIYLFPSSAIDTNKPLIRPTNCKKTDIDIYYVVNDNSTSIDWAPCKILVDWELQKFSCTMNLYSIAIGTYSMTEFCIFPNLLFGSHQFYYNSSPNINQNGYGVYEIDTPPIIHIDDDRVYKLPCWKVSTFSETAAFNICIKHYF